MPGDGKTTFEVAVGAIRRHRPQYAQVLANTCGAVLRLGVVGDAQA